MGTSKDNFECKSNNNKNKNKNKNSNNSNNNNKNNKNDEKMEKNEDVKVKKGVWSVEEDQKLIDFISSNNGDVVNWRSLPHLAGILRCGKSCRLRWTNYLRPDINRGPFTPEERKNVVQLHALLGNRWSAIAARLPGRTDNDVKNFWNTHLRKKQHGLIRRSSAPPGSPNTQHTVQWESIRLETEARLSLELAYYPFGYPVQSFDPFLHLWYSDTGASFREFGRGLGSSTSENCSEITGNVDQATEFCAVKDEQMSADDSEENCSDTALDVLLDSPTSD